MANISSPQMFESWAEGTSDVVILAGKAVLSVVIQWIEFVTPFSREVEPLSGSVGCSIGRAQCIRNMIVRVSQRVKSRIPKGTTISLVMEDSKRENIRVCAWRCIHCVGTNCRIDNGLFHVSRRGKIQIIPYLPYSRFSPQQSSYTLSQKNVH